MRPRLILGIGLACLVALPTLIHAGTAKSAPAAYLKAGAGARAQGMGNAAVALVDDATSTAWNPAGLTRLGEKGTQLATMYTFMNLERNYDFIAFAQHLEGWGDLGLSMTHFGVEGIEGTDRQGNATGTFSDQELALGLSYANFINYQFRAGATVRGLYHGLASSKAFGYGLDLGTQYQPSVAADFILGALLRDPVGTLSWDTGRQETLAPLLKLGMADRFFDQRLAVAADLDIPFESESSMLTHVGIELWFLEGLAGRAGVDQRDLCAGGTWRQDFYQFDYAFVLNRRSLGDAHQISLLLKF